MALPYAFYGSTLGGVDGGRGQFGCEYNGAIYVFLDFWTSGNPSSLWMRVYKSLDGGNSWTIAGGNGPCPNPGYIPGFGDFYTVARDGATVWVVGARHWLNDTIVPSINRNTPVVASFNLDTEQWSGTAQYPNIVMYPVHRGTADGSRQMGMHLCVRGPSDYVLLFSGPNEPPYYTSQFNKDEQQGLGRVYYATFDGTSFGTPVKLPDQEGSYNYPINGVADSSGVVHFLWIDGLSTAHVVALNPDGSFGSTDMLLSRYRNAADPYSIYIWNDVGVVSPLITYQGVEGEERLGFLAWAEQAVGEYWPNPVVMVSNAVESVVGWQIDEVAADRWADRSDDLLTPNYDWFTGTYLALGQNPVSLGLHAFWTHITHPMEPGTNNHRGEIKHMHSGDGATWVPVPEEDLYQTPFDPEGYGFVLCQVHCFPLSDRLGVLSGGFRE